jgi:hypothetical protein
MKFTKAQYDHMSRTFDNLIKEAVSSVCIAPPEFPTYEEYAGMINSGVAKLDIERLFPRGGKCPYHFKEMLEYFDFPGKDELEAKQLRAGEDAAAVNVKLRYYLNNLLNKYVVGMIEDVDILKELKRIEFLPKKALRKFIDSIKIPK